MDKGSIIRTILLSIALVNQITGTTMIALDEQQIVTIVDSIYLLISTLATLITAVMAWWKNNSFTKEAKQADNYLESIKKEENFK